jgi:hypothetical protein
MIVMFVVVQDCFSMDTGNNRRKIEFNLSNDNGNLHKLTTVSVMVYSYNPNTGYVEMGGFILDSHQGSTISRTMDLYKGPLIEKPAVQKKSKFPKLSRRSTHPEAQQAVKEGYIEKIEIEEAHGIVFRVDSETIDVINRLVDDNPGQLLTFQIAQRVDQFNGSRYYTINLIGSREVKDL